MKKALLIAFGVIASLVILYFMYSVFKTVSYNLFYESMVQDTVNEALRLHGLIE